MIDWKNIRQKYSKSLNLFCEDAEYQIFDSILHRKTPTITGGFTWFPIWHMELVRFFDEIGIYVQTPLIKTGFRSKISFSEYYDQEPIIFVMNEDGKFEWIKKSLLSVKHHMIGANTDRNLSLLHCYEKAFTVLENDLEAEDLYDQLFFN